MIPLNAIICLITMTKKVVKLGVTHLGTALFSNGTFGPNCDVQWRITCPGLSLLSAEEKHKSFALSH